MNGAQRWQPGESTSWEMKAISIDALIGVYGFPT
jgi:hypothetical protein